MRSYDEPIDVRPGRVDDQEGPAQFVWRRRLHRINRIQTRWLETDPWWEGDAVRAARGEFADPVPGAESPDRDVDLTGEREIWRVEASIGGAGDEGVYEIVHTWTSGQWRLRRVVD